MRATQNILKKHLKAKGGLGLFKQKATPRTQACQKVIKDEIHRIQKLEKSVTQSPSPTARSQQAKVQIKRASLKNHAKINQLTTSLTKRTSNDRG